MKKMRKILAVLLTLAMVMAMNLTSFAAEAPAETATITVKGLTANDSTTLKLYQIVSLDVENSTWDVADWAEEYVNLDVTPITFDWTALKENAPEADAIEVEGTSYKFTELAVGAYMILAAGETTQYNVMGTGTYDYDKDNNLIVPVDKTISAKGSGYTVTKTVEDGKTFVAKGDTVKFNIETIFPSFADDAVNKTFTITDTPTGMKITAVKVFVNNEEVAAENYTVSELNVADKAVTVAFKEAYIGEENAHATETVKVEVTAVITSDNAYNNKAESNFDSEGSNVPGDIGSLTINKVDKDGNALAGAKFEITLKGEQLTFAKEADGVYVLVAGATETSATDVDYVESPANGEILIKGLGAGTYEIVEAEAPAGYSVVEVEDVVISAGERADVEIEVINTRLSALPSTGGIGTTIFTIGGCAIMVAAAYMFFANRRKEEQ